MAGTLNQFTITDTTTDAAGFLWSTQSSGEPALNVPVNGHGDCPTATKSNGTGDTVSGTTVTSNAGTTGTIANSTSAVTSVTFTITGLPASTPIYVKTFDMAGNVSAETTATYPSS